MSVDDDAVRLTVPDAAAGERLDRWLAARLEGHSRSQVRRAIDEGRVSVAGATPPKAGHALAAGDAVLWRPERGRRTDAPEAEELPLDVVHEDEALLVVHKAAGVVVHPAPGHPSGTLVHALMYHVPSLSDGHGRDRPGIVHRLDRDTSGLLVVAKTNAAQAALSAQFAAHSVHRVYRAVVYGPGLADEGTIETRYGRHPRDRKRMTGRLARGRRACTRWRVLARGQALALVALTLETGRTHQIRVHMSEAGHAVVADPIYGPRRAPTGGGGRIAVELAVARHAPRLALHAAELGFVHPVTGAEVRFAAADPEDFAALVACVTGGG